MHAIIKLDKLHPNVWCGAVSVSPARTSLCGARNVSPPPNGGRWQACGAMFSLECNVQRVVARLQNIWNMHIFSFTDGACTSRWRPPWTLLPEHVVRGAALAHRVHPRLDEDLLPVLRDPQRLVQSVFVQRHLLPASPQQPPPSLVLTMGLEVRGRPSAALSVTETVSFGFGFFYVLKIKSSQKLKNGSKQNR